MKLKFQKGQGLINVIFVLAIIVFAGGILYLLFFSPAKESEVAKTSEFPQAANKPTEESVKEPIKEEPKQEMIQPQKITPPPQELPKQEKPKLIEKFAMMVYDGPIYNGSVDSYRVISKFYETHPDIYDFIATYSIIPTSMSGASGMPAKNGIRGNGSIRPDFDETAKYGSNGKLLTQVLMWPDLGLDASGGIDLLGTLVHEVSHRWLMFLGDIADCKDNPNADIRCTETPTGFRVNRNGAHWSVNVDTFVREGGIVFKEPNGGSAWQMNTGGYCSGVPATGNGVRFNDIDLYLMGFLSPTEAKPISG